MVEYLRGKSLPTPLAVEEAPGTLAAGHGTLTPSFLRGDLFLVDDAGRSHRLSWSGDEGDSERRRALPAGDYALRTYRIVRDVEGVTWHVSASAPRIRGVRVVAGEDARFDVSASIRLRSRVAGGQARMTIQGDAKAGLTIYRAGKRIPIDYRITDEGGATLASGAMRYG